MSTTWKVHLTAALERLRVSINLKIDHNLERLLRDLAWVLLGGTAMSIIINQTVTAVLNITQSQVFLVTFFILRESLV